MIVLISLLVVLCICAAELTACYFFEPVLYRKITAPVYRGIQTAERYGSYAVERLSDGVSNMWEEITLRLEQFKQEHLTPAPEEAEEPEPLESQLAGEPALIADIIISDPSITELVTDGSQEILTGGIIPIVYYNQGDERWASEAYGSDHIGGYGCGPTTMLMAVSSMTGLESDPVQMALFASRHGYWAKNSGSYLSIVNGIATEYDLTAASIESYTVEDVQNALLSGNLLVALMGPGHFTKGGHFILLRGITLSGSILVADPNSRERSLSEWDPQLILDELSSSTAHGAPLWVISPSQ